MTGHPGWTGTALAAAIAVAIPCTLAADQPQWGARHSRNMVSAETGLVVLDGDGKEGERIDLKFPVSPIEALVLDQEEPLPAEAAAVRLVLFDSGDKEIGELARVQVRK